MSVTCILEANELLVSPMGLENAAYIYLHFCLKLKMTNETFIIQPLLGPPLSETLYQPV